MSWSDLARGIGPLLLAFGGALGVDFLAMRRGLAPPGFAPLAGASPEVQALALVRRLLALGVLATVFYFGIFAQLGLVGLGLEPDLSGVKTPELFLVHSFFLVGMVAWYLLGFAGAGVPLGERRWPAQFGFRAPSILGEIGIGLLAGLGAWMLVLAVLLVLSVLIWALGGEEILPSQPPAIVFWMAALPAWVRVAVSVSAGVVEEAFFRGFLQPRVGIALSTVFFTLAHLGYEQPMMLVGVTLLSLLFAQLVHWRQNIWSAITAHAVFDAIQLLIVIPAALRFLEGRGEPGLSVLIAGALCGAAPGGGC